MDPKTISTSVCCTDTTHIQTTTSIGFNMPKIHLGVTCFACMSMRCPAETTSCTRWISAQLLTDGQLPGCFIKQMLKVNSMTEDRLTSSPHCTSQPLVQPGPLVHVHGHSISRRPESPHPGNTADDLQKQHERLESRQDWDDLWKKARTH